MTTGSFSKQAQIEIIDDLPKSGMGKILKTELRAKFWEGMKKKVN